MIKSIKTIMRQDKEKYKVPRKVQDIIPIQCVWKDGIFKVGNKFSKTFKFTDINYLVASREDKESMFLTYSELLNSLDSGATTKITVYNQTVNQSNFEESILMPMRGDELDVYRREYNKMLMDKAMGANCIMQVKLITISVAKKDIKEARSYFARIGADLTAHFVALGSKCAELNADDRLRVFHDFFRPGDESAYSLSLSTRMKLGHDFRDYICPDSLEKHSDYLKIGGKFARVIFLKDYASYIKDSMVTELTDLNRSLMFSIDINPIPTDEAVREVESRLLGVETNITNWQRRQNSNNNFSAVVPYDMELQRKESKEFLDDLTTRDQRMMFAVMTMVHTADTKEQLDSDTDAILSIARKHMCQMATLKYQQMDGLKTVLPFGVRKIDAFRTLTTESLAVFIPFKVQEIMDKGGIYFGENAISHNLIMCNRENLMNQSTFILGVPGSGKSFSAKELIFFLLLNTDDDILICDPEGEYASMLESMQKIASIIRASAGGRDRLNAMYMVDGYDFNDDQLEQLEALLDDENNSLWTAVLYDISTTDDQIVAVALSQIGNVGGQPYWSWYGFGSRVEWCACFVSWCANECGYIDTGVIPKFAGCVNGVNWFRDRGQWADNSAEPTPGMIIFFDWDNPSGSSGPQDGLSDHVGIVEKVENGRVYTIEGNSGDSCRRRDYPLGYYEILGYGIPAY